MSLITHSASSVSGVTGSPTATRLGRVLAAVAVTAGTGIAAAGPLYPTGAEHHALRLVADADAPTDGMVTWSDLAATTQQNLAALLQQVTDAPFPILTQVGQNMMDYAQLITGMADVSLNESGSKTITSGFQGIAEGVQAMLVGSDHAPGLLELLQIMVTDIQNGDPVNAFNELNLWTLYGLEGVLKPQVPMVTIPDRILDNFTSMISQTVGPEHLWDFGKAISKAISSPMIGLGYEAATIIGQLQAALGGGDLAGALDALVNAPAGLLNAVINGYLAPGASSAFAGLLNHGGLVEGLLVTWPQQIGAALTVGTADLPVNTPDVPDDVVNVPVVDTGSDLADLFPGF